MNCVLGRRLRAGAVVVAAVVASGCGAAHQTAKRPDTKIAETDFDSLLATCRTAAESLGFDVRSGVDPIPNGFDGLLLEPGLFELGTDGAVVERGNAEVVTQNPYLCGFGRLAGNCTEIPDIVVSSQGNWAVVARPLPPQVAPPPADPACAQT